MDQAIYEPTTQKIFGVRGQWLFKFNSVTGAIEDTLRFAANVNGPSSIVAIGGLLYIGTTVGMSTDVSVGSAYPDADIYVVNAAAFVFVSRFNFGSKNSLPASESQICGWRYLVTDGTNLYGWNGGCLAFPNKQLFSVNPSNLASFNSTSFDFLSDIYCDTVNSVLWLADNATPNLWAIDFAFTNQAFDTNGTLPVNGVTYNSAQNKVLAVKGDFGVVWGSAAGINPGFANFPVFTVNSGEINANPYRIKSVNGFGLNPHNGKVLVPCWFDDTVLIFDPLTNSFSAPLTGFTSPIDIVVTPTANFAVQSGITGLRLIP